MTVFIRVKTDPKGQFHLLSSSRLPEGDNPVEICGKTIKEVEEALASLLSMDEAIITLKNLPTLNISAS